MAKGGRSIEIQPRDWELLRGLFESRVMTRKQIFALYFPSKLEMGKKRLQRLIAAGIIRERPRRHAADPAVLFLTREAFRLLKDHGDLAKYPQLGIDQLEKRVQVSELKLRHELEVIDVKVAFTTAINSSSRFSIAEFSTNPILYQFKSCEPRGREVTTQPDAYVRIHEKLDDGGVSEHYFFFEVDRSKEARIVLAERAHCYQDFYRTGGLALRYGLPIEAYKEFGFRVLGVFKTAERRNNIAAKLLLNTPPVHTQVWLTALPDFLADPLGAIWIRPVDYRDVTRGTAFDPYREADRIYRRSVEREVFVEGVIQKHKILET